jgi:poly-beta-hydroxyalkanoate depolymerase
VTWKNTLIIIDALLWALGAPDDRDKQLKLRDIFPALKGRIEKYLDKISDYYEPEAQALFDLLLEYQSDGEMVMEEDVYVTNLDQEEISPAETDKVELDDFAQKIEPVDEKSEEKDEEVEFTIEEDLIARRLSISEFGTWFEFDNDKADEPMRAKLSWYSPLTKRYMFVDRNGAQVAVRPLTTLVKELSGGSARILEPPVQSFLDQAITAIKDMLERAVGVVKPVAS